MHSNIRNIIFIEEEREGSRRREIENARAIYAGVTGSRFASS